MPKSLAPAQVNRFIDSFHSSPTDTFSLGQALESIRTSQYKSRIAHVRRVLAQQGKPAYDRAKSTLPAYTFGGTFAPRRAIACLQQHSGIVHGDLDDVAEVKALKGALAGNPHTVYCFVSPSATGLKIGVRVPIVTDDARYKHAWQTVSAAYERLYRVAWDPSGKDICRLCFISDDPYLYMNFTATVFNVPAAPWPEPQPQRPSVSRPHTDDRDYGERAIRTAVEMIQSAELGTRHHTRLKAARLLGGYVAGGRLTEGQAYGALASALVGHTEDLERALKTVQDGLAYGQGHPITVEALEADRQTWLTQHRSRYPHRDGLPSSDLWDGVNTLPLKPYIGYRGMTIRRAQTHG
jgi:hypothetical protein